MVFLLRTRQKNWMPFEYEGKLMLVANVHPHRIYEFDGEKSHLAYETNYLHPWFYQKNDYRGNCNIIKLEDSYLGTFHTVEIFGVCHYYDNGFYEFEAKPPFKVIRAGFRTYLPAEAASEPPCRKKGFIRVCFPVGMVKEQDKLLISYGDNDSAVRVMQTTVQEARKTMCGVYEDHPQKRKRKRKCKLFL